MVVLDPSGYARTTPSGVTFLPIPARHLTPTSDTPRGWNDHGGELFAAGRYAEALASFERAIAGSPLYVEAWINKANALFEAGRRDDALQAALRAIEVAPLFARTWFNKGAMENRMGRSALALASFREYVSLGNDEPAKLLAQARRTVRELEAGGSKPAPRSAHGWLTEAGRLSAEGKFAQAAKALDRALALLPHLGAALLLKGDALVEMGQPRKAMACYDEGLEADRTDSRLWNAKGAFLSRQRRHDEALACYDEALRLDPGNALVRSGRAWALLQGGRQQEALAAFDEALAADPRFALARFGKACAEDQLGRTAAAARSYRKFLDGAPRRLAPQVDHARARLRALKP